MDRPTGVTILAVLHFLGAAAYIFAALGLFALGAGGAMAAAEMPELDGAAAFLLGLGGGAGVHSAHLRRSLAGAGNWPVEAAELGARDHYRSGGSGPAFVGAEPAGVVALV